MTSGNLVDTFSHQVCYMEFSDSAKFDYPQPKVFDVVADIERYPEFLPGWQKVSIKEANGHTVVAEQELGIATFSWCFNSRAVFEQPSHIHVSALDGPFQHLDIDWRFESFDENHTQIYLTIKTDSAPGPQYQFLHALVSSSTHSILDRFRERVAQVCSGRAE